MNRFQVLMAGFALSLALAGCTPEVGSERWCENLQEKSKGDWTANEATAYARHCLFKSSDEG